MAIRSPLNSVGSSVGDDLENDFEHLNNNDEKKSSDPKIAAAAALLFNATRSSKVLKDSFKRRKESACDFKILFQSLIFNKYCLFGLFLDRVLYARKAGEGDFGTQVDDGEKITQEIACVSKYRTTSVRAPSSISTPSRIVRTP